jgi:hypothetical protein
MSALMFSLVADLTEGDAVRHVEPQVGKIGKALYVMGMEVSTSVISALLAGEAITREHVVSPPLVRLRKPGIPTFRQLAVFEGMTRITARCSLARPIADLLSCLRAVFLPDAAQVLAPLASSAHRLARCNAVRPTFEGRNPTFGRLPHANTATGFTTISKTVGARSVASEALDRLPIRTLGATTQSGSPATLVVLKGQAELFCRDLVGAKRCLSHG